MACFCSSVMSVEAATLKDTVKFTILLYMLALTFCFQTTVSDQKQVRTLIKKGVLITAKNKELVQWSTRVLTHPAFLAIARETATSIITGVRNYATCNKKLPVPFLSSEHGLICIQRNDHRYSLPYTPDKVTMFNTASSFPAARLGVLVTRVTM